jgi:putative phosphoesterase
VRIAIISDIHDNVWNLDTLVESIKGLDAVICCGDLCSPFIIDLMAQNLSNCPIHIVFGNNDGDTFRITQKAGVYKNVYVHGEFAELVELEGELIDRKNFEKRCGNFFDAKEGGKRFAINHYDSIAYAIASTERYDVVCYGHNHLYRVERLGKTLLINPGTVMGYDVINKKDIPPTFVVYDTNTDTATGFEISFFDKGERKVLPIK